MLFKKINTANSVMVITNNDYDEIFQVNIF